ncbi:GxxExxY protein [bacterium]|nr:MAG: GxxExxY protein [bacterium]
MLDHEIHPSPLHYAEADERHEKIIFKEKSYAIQGAIFEVYKIMGSGFLEAVYQECLEKEFDLRKIPFKSQKEIRSRYKNIPLNQTYRAGFICFDSILIEIKAVSQILDVHRAQVLNYIEASNLKLGLLVNFSSFPKVDIERIVL